MTASKQGLYLQGLYLEGKVLSPSKGEKAPKSFLRECKAKVLSSSKHEKAPKLFLRECRVVVKKSSEVVPKGMQSYGLKEKARK